jgi:hypothetical protein
LQNASNQTASPIVAQALVPVAEVANVIGVALVAPEGEAVAHQSQLGLPAATFTEVAQCLQESLRVFESLEAAPNAALALHFESATVLARWVESHLLVVVATEQAHPTVLSVSMNAAASRLLSLAQQDGGAAHAFRCTSSCAEARVQQTALADSVQPGVSVPPRYSSLSPGRESQPQGELGGVTKPRRSEFYRSHKIED